MRKIGTRLNILKLDIVSVLETFANSQEAVHYQEH